MLVVEDGEDALAGEGQLLYAYAAGIHGVISSGWGMKPRRFCTAVAMPTCSIAKRRRWS